MIQTLIIIIGTELIRTELIRTKIEIDFHSKALLLGEILFLVLTIIVLLMVKTASDSSK
jgi:hypothetical protein